MSGVKGRSGRKFSQICGNGHDKHVVGMYRGQCMECRRLQNKRRTAKVGERQAKNRKSGKCLAGHEFAVVGRIGDNEHGSCAECNRIQSRDFSAVHRHPDYAASKANLPLEPLERAINQLGFAIWGISSSASIRRWRVEGIRPIMADDICFRVLGKHPVEVYGAELWLGFAPVETKEEVAS